MRVRVAVAAAIGVSACVSAFKDVFVGVIVCVGFGGTTVLMVKGGSGGSPGELSQAPMAIRSNASKM